MKVTLKIQGTLLDAMRADLERHHEFAYERVGFMLAAATQTASGLMLMVQDYHPVSDDDYEQSHTVGAQIGSDAMRKAIQAAYRPSRALLHVHTHHGRGTPHFSGVDLRSAEKFVPGFFNPIPKMPHGLIVLSDDSAAGKLWLGANGEQTAISKFIRVGAPYRRAWASR
jgi:hypothetical protein